MNEKEKLLACAKLIKKHCDKHCFYNNDGYCKGCVFAKEGEACPFGDPVPADWEV